MPTILKNINADLYSNDLFDSWINRKNLIPVEEFLLKKYLTDTTKSVLEAGTGGGRISFRIEQMGFSNISAFDFAPIMIMHANKVAKNAGSNVQFKILDASNLAVYESNTFDYLIYLQQVLCFIDKEDLFIDSLKEAYRIAKQDGIIIYSFLDFDSRIFNPTLSKIISILRKLRKECISKQHLPWLKINNKFNWKLFNKNQPVTYWVKRDQIISVLKEIGFSIVEANNANQVTEQNDKKRLGMLYIVCRK
jgi:ubiquinone/menaquinone biosynthesis C-methylase UbiE